MSIELFLVALAPPETGLGMKELNIRDEVEYNESRREVV